MNQNHNVNCYHIPLINKYWKIFFWIDKSQKVIASFLRTTQYLRTTHLLTLFNDKLFLPYTLSLETKKYQYSIEKYWYDRYCINISFVSNIEIPTILRLEIKWKTEDPYFWSTLNLIGIYVVDAYWLYKHVLKSKLQRMIVFGFSNILASQLFNKNIYDATLDELDPHQYPSTEPKDKKYIEWLWDECFSKYNYMQKHGITHKLVKSGPELAHKARRKSKQIIVSFVW